MLYCCSIQVYSSSPLLPSLAPISDNGRLNLVMSLVSREATSIDAEYRHLLSDVLPKLQWFTSDSQNVVEATLICRDKRQNGTCGCVQR